MRDLAKEFDKKVQSIVAHTKWCPICNYPLHDNDCLHCRDVKASEEDQRRAKKEADINRLGGLRPYEDFTLEKLDSKHYDAAKAKEIAQWNENLYVWGTRGVGKTHLATAIIRLKPEGVVENSQVMLRKIKEKALDYREKMRLIEYYAKHRALCIDDLGAEKMTDASKSDLYEIINRRWLNKVDGLIVTSNFGPDELASHLEDDRIISRLIGMSKVIRLTGTDRRLEETK